MRAILSVHADRRFPIPVSIVNYVIVNYIIIENAKGIYCKNRITRKGNNTRKLSSTINE